VFAHVCVSDNARKHHNFLQLLWQNSRSAGENVLASSPAQQDAEGAPAVFIFKKLRTAENSRASETMTPPRVGPNTTSPDTFFTPEMEAKKDPLAGGMLQDMIMRLESAMGMVMENLKDLRENQHGLRENQNALIQTQNTLIAMQQQTEAVGQHNTKDINQLRQQTEFKHVSGMEQIHA
jgi:hypothetical protein